MNENNIEKLNWEGLVKYTFELKEWVFKLFQKVHARIGHVEEDLYKVAQSAKLSYVILKRTTSTGIVYVLLEENSKLEKGTINISSEGVVLSTWEEELNI